MFELRKEEELDLWAERAQIHSNELKWAREKAIETIADKQNEIDECKKLILDYNQM